MEMLPSLAMTSVPNGPASQLMLLQMMTQIFNKQKFISNLHHDVHNGEIDTKAALPKILRTTRDTDDINLVNNVTFRELVLENHRLKKELLEKDEKILELTHIIELQECASSSERASEIKLKENVERIDKIIEFSEILNNISIINSTITLAKSNLEEQISKLVNGSQTILQYVYMLENGFILQNNLLHYLVQISEKYDFTKMYNNSQYPQQKCKRSFENATESKIIEKKKLLEKFKKELESAKKYNELLYIYYKYDDKLTGLQRASLKCDLSDVKLLVDHGASLSKMDKSEFGNTAVHLASVANCTSVVDWITQNSSFVDIQNKIGATPLHICAEFNHLEIAKLLIHRNANIVARTLDERTPLHFAAQYGHLQMAELLLHQGADVKALSQYYGTPLHTAAHYSKLDIVRILLDFGADVNSISGFGTPLHVASQGSDYQVAEMLLENGATLNSVNEEKMTPLHVAAEYNAVQVAQVLIINGSDLEAEMENKFTPLHVSARNGSLEVARFLIDSGAQIDSKSKEGLTPLYIAAENGKRLVGRLLLERGARLNALPHVRFSKYLVDVLYAEGLLELTERDKELLLIDASRYGNLTLARLLIEVGTYVSSTSTYGFSPLHWSATKGYIELAVVLLDAGADIEKADWHGFTPLNRAAWNGHLDICKLLIDRGANLESRNIKRHTPLQGAAMQGYLEVVQLLVEHGANVTATNSFGRTALQEAILNRHLEVAKWLSQYERVDLSDDNKTVRNVPLEDSLLRFRYNHL